MAQRFVSLNLQDTVFPMLSEQQGRTVLIAGDSVPNKNLQVGVTYCHNVMPTDYGMNSVGYLPVIPAFASIPAGLELTDVKEIFGDTRTRLYLAWDAEGNVYALLKGSLVWIAIPATTPATGGTGFDINSVTTGTVNGITYIAYSTVAVFTYDEGANALVQATLTGLSMAAVLGVTSSSGYLIAYTNEALAWSSTILPTDFVPSQVTGSGGGNIADIQGDIIFCTSNSLGILIYSAANAVAGVYSGNVQYPFKLREVPNSKGGISLDLTAHEANSSQQFIFSKAGLQSLTSQAATVLLPSVTDFLAGKRFEDFNETTKQYVVTDLAAGATMLKKVKYVASRYLVVSYGLTSFTHVLVWDTALQKAGKLRIDHTDVFEYIGAQSEVSKESMAFLLPTGEVKVLDFSVTAESKGVLILGKLQYSFTRMINLLGLEVENVQSASDLEVTAQVSLNGKTFVNVEGFLDVNAPELREFKFKDIGKNVSLVFIGKFDFVSAIVTYALAGRR
tara:strand:- start:6208 stop:7722 length:1515 start_codon:yes stop_codon:yes gene_type:complete